MRYFLPTFLLLTSFVSASDDADQLAFFEAKIRPVLVDRCYGCHSSDSDAAKGMLRLDHATTTLQGGESGAAVVPGKPRDSLLLSAIKYESFEMPPDERLPPSVVADFEKWISDGAIDPRRDGKIAKLAPEEIDFQVGRKFWAFQPPELSPSLANQGDGSDRAGRIDRLVGIELSKHNITANRLADRRTLLRRLTFDLTGLPPTPEAVDEFVNNSSATLIEETVAGLLQSSAYGQHWARMWLDVARFAEDQAHIVGNNKALFYPNAWKYRDWVIQSLNEDLPYDRFVQLQLAADLVEPDNAAAQPALGFMGLGPKYYRRNDPEVMAEEWEDRVDVVCRGLQGLTVACARCHDHKFDPIATEDYYALAGVFASSKMQNVPIDPTKKSKDKKGPKPEDCLHVVRDAKAQDLAVMIRGKVDQKGDIVPRGFLQVVFDGPRREFKSGSGRQELAAAIIDPLNPLTARVIVNRIWQQYFGVGLVSTPSNFGSLGERPTHPELLDDLAVRFMNSGWSLKWLHREIVLSDAYQRSSDGSNAAMETDPQNKWLWRMPRRRLSIEAWRDAALLVSGQLDEATGGESISVDDPQQTRRTVYAKVSRFELNPLLARFDFPDPNAHAARRIETNTPLQKLFLLNNPLALSLAEKLAARVTEKAQSKADQLTELFRLTVQRSPDEFERAAALQLMNATDDGLKQVAHSLIASNEFWYLD